MSETGPNAFQEFRQSVLATIETNDIPIPKTPHVAFVWPTELCGIGCRHCSYSSTERGPAPTIVSHIPLLIRWLSDAGVSRFVACGGGEPLDQPEAIREAIQGCADAGLHFELYTSGIASDGSTTAKEFIEQWRRIWEQKRTASQTFSVRLSYDAFHEERLGLAPLTTWLHELRTSAPDWLVSLRGLDVCGDESLQRLAAALSGQLVMHNQTNGVLQFDGASIPLKLKAFVLEGRGSQRQLARLGLSLRPADHQILSDLNLADANRQIGRPFSLRFAMSRRRVDLEIHSDCTVYMLQSQAPDLRLRFTDYSWADIRSTYYRDPLLHTAIDGGLSAIAQLLRELRSERTGIPDLPLFSIEMLEDSRTLALATAKAVLHNSDDFKYRDTLKARCQEFLDANSKSNGG